MFYRIAHILLIVLIFISRFVETVLALPMVAINMLFTSRFEYLLRYLVIRRRRKGGFLRIIQREHAWRILQERKQRKKDAQAEMAYSAVVAAHIMNREPYK